MINLKKEAQSVKGVGPTRANLLQKLGINTLEDLITYFPRDYEDRSNPKQIAEVVDGEETLIEAVAMSRLSETKIRANMSICKLTVRDETGILVITWFNMGYLKNYFKIGQKYSFFGKIKRTPRWIKC